ncbi:MAG: type I-G CRISPR-associated protein Csb2 [Bacillota bacterium]
MIGITVTFLSGRYHATPWGRHVNEGVPEWPPAPWRLLRAIISVWQRTAKDVPEEQVRGLIDKLAVAPEFWLPPATLAQVRYYMPWFKKGPGDRTLIMDTFVAPDQEQPLVVHWPEANLESEERDLLGRLIRNIPYLGRAESWVSIDLTEGYRTNCVPLDERRMLEGDTGADDSEPVRVLLPAAGDGFAFTDLLIDTTDLRLRRRRIDPPGSKWVTYARPRNVLRHGADPALTMARAKARLYRGEVNMARYALDGNPTPLVTETVTVGEVARRAAMARYGRANGGAASPVLAGKDANGVPLKGHRHAFYLPTDEDLDGRLDHLTIYASSGFSQPAQEALASLRELNFGEGAGEVRLLLLGLGTTGDLVRPGRASDWGPAAVWQSATPYIMARHPKASHGGQPKLTPLGFQRDGPEDQILNEWENRRKEDPSLPELVHIERVDRSNLKGRRIRWLQFRRWRRFGGGESVGGAYGFRLTFAAPITGPVALGYGNHFGLGLFRAVGQGGRA